MFIEITSGFENLKNKKMKIQNTEKSCWSNGHQIRGGSFHTFACSVSNFAMMLSFDKKRFFKTLNLQFYKLQQSKK